MVDDLDFFIETFATISIEAPHLFPHFNFISFKCQKKTNLIEING